MAVNSVAMASVPAEGENLNGLRAGLAKMALGVAVEAGAGSVASDLTGGGCVM